jgi:putative FmdB family regulatory protein
MPLYAYSCGACGAVFEELRRMDAAAPPCPECGERERVERRLSAFAAQPGRRPPSTFTPAMTRGDPPPHHH